jgi:ribose-phosphate pyrophosphokinase
LKNIVECSIEYKAEELAMPEYADFTTIPVGQLGILALPGCEKVAEKIDTYLVKWRKERESEHKMTLPFA